MIHIPEALPVDPYLDAILAAVRENRAVVVTAAPGAGKTTRVPPALAADGRLLLLQPRRVAARSIARRIAEEQGWALGREVGWHVRFDRRESAETRLLVATEGVLTARLQQDPLLSDFLTVILDEFHERSIHADLGLTLARQAWRARDDLRLVVMSATLDAVRVAAYLGGCPVIEVPGRSFHVEVSYRPGATLETVALEELRTTSDAVLCFLPGAGEIRKAAATLESVIDGRTSVLPLHGGLDADAQDAVLTPSPRPRIILATNIAETTLTVPDVRVVIDAGLQKVARYDSERGIDSLETERVSTDAADQRAGRAGRLGPGRAVRLWDPRDRLRPYREPDIVRVDLAAPLMELFAWGGRPDEVEWFEPPPAERIARAVELLESLGAVSSGRLSPLGEILRRLPVHPRLARLLVEARGAHVAAVACAILSERHYMPAARESTSCDLLAAADRERELPFHVRRVANDLETAAANLLGDRAARTIDEADFRRSVLAAYSDRVARRRAPTSDRFLLASGSGARLGRESGVVSAEFVVAVDVSSGTSRAGEAEALIRMATRIEREWVVETSTTIDHAFDAASGRVRAVCVERVGAIALSEREVEPNPGLARSLLVKAWIERGPAEGDEQLLRRLRFAGQATSLEPLVERAAERATRLSDIDLAASLQPAERLSLDRSAPLEIRVPSGRTARLTYHADGRITAAVKLQELFGLAESPRIGHRQTPVTFELLSPAGRPVQLTSDLKSFWANGYQEVRRELRARYPRHPWPDDPWSAPATHRTERRRKP